MKVLFILYLALLAIPSIGIAQGYLEFTENKGQWDNDILYKANIGGGLIAITKTGYRILKYDAASQKLMRGHNHEVDNKKDNRIRGYVWNVNFTNTNANKRVLPSKPVSGISNYYIGNEPSKWTTGCQTFTKIKIENLYNNIDIEYYTSNNTLKYDIIVHPGGNPDDIRLAYNGVNKITKGKNGQLIIHTSIGKFEELYPYTYQVIDNQKKVINSGYKIKDNELTYALADYEKASTLVIDPTLIFSTHSGSTADNWGFTATYGPDETFYGGGDIRGQGFPVSAGSFDNSFNGPGAGTDVAIIKLSQNGQNRLYSTYIGGGGEEQPHSLICDPQGNLVIAGRTSSTNFPTTVTFGTLGGYDIFITKLNANGSALIGSMKIGGSADDGVNIDATRSSRTSTLYNYGDDGRSEVNLDAQGNIIVASCTKSNNFFTTPGVIQTTLGGGANTQDAVFVKVNPTLSSLVFSTYFGGTGDDAAYVVNVNPEDGNIYFAGGTASLTLTGTGGTVIQNVNSGSIDGFVTIINPTGTAVVKTTFIGTGQHDQIFGIQFDKFNFPYIMGITLGTMTPINAAFSQPGSHQFIAKLEKDLSNYVYRTIFGSNTALPNISPVAFLVDKCQNVYVSGWGGTIGQYNLAGTTGMSITPDQINGTKPPDGKDFYYYVLERNAQSQLFGSYFGGTQSGSFGEHVDGGTSRFDPKGYIYQAACASCGGATGANAYPTSPAGLQQNGSNNCNLGMTKIRFNLNGVGSDLKADDTVGCVPLTVNFRDEFLNAVSYEYSFADGSPLLNTTATTATHTFNTPGFYRVRLVAIDLNSCNLRDTSYVTIRVRGDSAILGFNGVKQPPCLNLSYQFNNLSVAPPGKPFTNNSFSWSFGDGTGVANAGTAPQLKTYTAAGTYTVRLILKDTNYCNAPDSISQVFRLSPTVKADFEAVNGCAPFTTTFNNTSLAGDNFLWNFGGGNTSTATNPTFTFTTPGTYSISLIASDPNTCNFIDSVRKTITVFPTPVANFSFAPTPAQVNTPTQFTNLSTNATIYKWIFGDGDSSTLVNPLHQYLQTATNNTCLQASNSFGCRDTICIPIPSIVEPVIDIPNAITPNGDGVNDVVIPRGFGIRKITFRIFNRWGNLIFETTTRNTGWDGKYKGEVQPMDAYAFTLDAEMVDGQKVRKSGNITLLR